VRAQARINQGSSDALVRFFKFSDEKGIGFKTGSIYGVYGLDFDLEDMSLDEITHEFGCCAPRAVVHVGRREAEDLPSTVWFLAEKRGICAIAESAEQGKLQVVSVPVSIGIEKVMQRMSWKNAGLARASQWDKKIYFALPLDEAVGYGPELVPNGAAYAAGVYSINVIPGKRYRWVKGRNEFSLGNGANTYLGTCDFTASSDVVTLAGIGSTALTAGLKRTYQGVNNAVLVYDTLRGNWAGYDIGTGLMVQEFVKLDYQGQRRLMALTADGFLSCYDEMFYDEVCVEALGANLTAGNYSGLGAVAVAVTAGRQYTYVKGANDTNLQNGTEVLTASGSFIAQGTTVVLGGTALAAVTARVRLVSWTLTEEWVEMDGLARGYMCGNPQRKQFVDLQLQVSTWYPEFKVSVKVDGVKEEYTLRARPKSNLVYDAPAHKAKWNGTNCNDDHATPKRQDYCVALMNTTTPSGQLVVGTDYYVEDLTGAASIVHDGNVINAPAMFTATATTYTVNSGTPKVYGPESYVFLGENGIDFNLHQETTETYTLPRSAIGKYCQVRIRNTRGRCVVKGVAITGRPVDRLKGSKS
jgi:hypothetical protein